MKIETYTVADYKFVGRQRQRLPINAKTIVVILGGHLRFPLSLRTMCTTEKLAAHRIGSTTYERTVIALVPDAENAGKFYH